MRYINENNRASAAVLAFMLVPLSGLSTDMYLPSFPSMAHIFQVSDAAIQMTLTVFLISYGIGQFIAGTVLDSFGRYRPTLLCLVLFIISSYLIVTSENIYMVYVYRALQGLCLSFVAVGKRTFFVDAYTGEKQKSYTAMNTIVWAVAPISAPFIGGFLQQHFDWKASFDFLGIYAFILFFLELWLSGETLKQKAEFKLNHILKTYGKLLDTRDFTVGVIVLGVSFSMVITFNMCIPFIVENNFHLSPVATGYCALCSGTSILIGGLIGRKITINFLYNKLWYFTLSQVVIVVIMFLVASLLTNVYSLMIFVILIHTIEGLTYNLFFTHCLTRFPESAATAGGITGGGSYIVVSTITSILFGVLIISNSTMLSIGYFILCALIIILLLIFKKSIRRANNKMMVKDRELIRKSRAYALH